DARAELGLIRCRVALARREHACPCGDAEPAELIRERRGAGELELRLGDEGAPIAALAAHEAAASLERAERLAKRHAADAVALGKLSLGRQAVGGGEPASLDRRLGRGRG